MLCFCLCGLVVTLTFFPSVEGWQAVFFRLTGWLFQANTVRPYDRTRGVVVPFVGASGTPPPTGAVRPHGKDVGYSLYRLSGRAQNPKPAPTQHSPIFREFSCIFVVNARDLRPYALMPLTLIVHCPLSTVHCPNSLFSP